MTIGWGIVGAGGWGDRVIAPAIKQSPDARLVAVLSRDQERADAIAKGHGAEKGYSSLESFLRHPGLDAVFVATPQYVHAESAVPALNAGKHVLVEVSIAVTEEDCLAMVEAARKNKVKLGSAFQTRHHPANLALKHLVDSGALGDLVQIRVQMSMTPAGPGIAPRRNVFTSQPTVSHPKAEWKLDPAARGGGALASSGKFPIDMLRYLSGREVEEVYAYSDAATEFRGLETYAAAILRLQGNITGFFDTYGADYRGSGEGVRNPYGDNNITVYGTRGRATSYGGMQLGSDGALEAVTDRGTMRTEYTGYNVYQNQLDAFHRAIREDVEPSASGVDGWRERMISIAMTESSLKGTPVKLRG